MVTIVTNDTALTTVKTISLIHYYPQKIFSSIFALIVFCPKKYLVNRMMQSNERRVSIKDERSQSPSGQSIIIDEYDPETHPPFNLSYIYGINRNLGVRILNRVPSKHFAIYSLGHVASLVNMKTHEAQHFHGHEGVLVSIEHDGRGIFAVSADADILFIWDLNHLKLDIEPVKVKIMHKPFGRGMHIAATALSECGKYLVVGSNKGPTGTMIQFWRWSFDHDESDADFQISDKFGPIKSIRFSQNRDEREYFIVTLKHGVVFAWWDDENNKLEVHTPDQKKFGTFCQSSYVPNRRTVASVTSRGHMVIWSDQLILDNKEPVTNKKNFVKSLTILENCSINDIQTFDDMLAICNEIGEIRFFDADFRLLYICRQGKNQPIDFIVPVMISKEIKIIEADDFDVEENDNVQVVYRTTCPTDYTLEAKPFIVREFYIVIRTGETLYCNIYKNAIKPVLYEDSDNLISFCMLKSKTQLLYANVSNCIGYFDYIKYQLIREQKLKAFVSQDEYGEDVKPSISCIRISEDEKYIAVGYDNGCIWMVDSVVLTPISQNPLHFSFAEIKQIVFSSHPTCAYVDANCTITLLRYLHKISEWKLIGKYRYHSKSVILLSIVHSVEDQEHLIGLGRQRLLVEYDLQKSIRTENLERSRDLILEQDAEFTAAIIINLSKIVSKDTSANGMAILVADDQYKFKIFDLLTFERLYVFTGPVFDAPVMGLTSLSEPHTIFNHLILFSTEKTLGCIVLPIDGNMFRYSGVVAHPQKINMLVPYGFDLFASAEDDIGGTIWSINEENIVKRLKSGGEGLAPFCKIIPGGKEGWMFKEMEDMFYYMQIMSQGGDAPEEHAVTDYINIDDLSDFMRGIGFFPSEYDIQCMKKEATRTTSPSIPPPTKISFEDTVKMYLNHKPIAGYQLDDIKNAFEHLADRHSSDFVQPTSDEFTDNEDEYHMSLKRLMNVLTARGEKVPRETAKRYLIELLSDEAGKMKITKLNVDDEFQYLPEYFSLKEFCIELLGIDVKENSAGDLLSEAGGKLNPAENNAQLENRCQINVPESDFDLIKERNDDDDETQDALTLKRGRVVKVNINQ